MSFFIAATRDRPRPPVPSRWLHQVKMYFIGLTLFQHAVRPLPALPNLRLLKLRVDLFEIPPVFFGWECPAGTIPTAASPGRRGRAPPRTPIVSRIVRGPRQSQETPTLKESPSSKRLWRPPLEEFRITGPLILAQLRHARDTRTHRIEVNVIDQPKKRPALLYYQALVSRLKNMPALASKGVEPNPEGPCNQRIPSTKFASGVSTTRW